LIMQENKVPFREDVKRYSRFVMTDRIWEAVEGFWNQGEYKTQSKQSAHGDSFD
jgi:hypothetical protein